MSIALQEKVAIQQQYENYDDIYQRRAEIEHAIRLDTDLLKRLHDMYALDPIAWIEDWVEIKNPKNARQKTVPFRLYPYQKRYIQFLVFCIVGGHHGIVEKCRDMGATWLTCAFSVWTWTYKKDFGTIWMSKKLDMLDRRGDPNSVFEKLRSIIKALPEWQHPIGFKPREHMTTCAIINPHNGSSIIGATGAEGARSGRASAIYRDEVAFYGEFEKIEAGSLTTANTIIDISTPNGTNNGFYIKRINAVDYEGPDMDPKGKVVCLSLKWMMHPFKTVEWFLKTKREFFDRGMSIIFKQEIECDYRGSLDGVLIAEEWAKATIDSFQYLGLDDDDGDWYGGLDLAGSGIDLNAFVARKGNVVKLVKKWPQNEDTANAEIAAALCRGKKGIVVNFDSCGVGEGTGEVWRKMERNGEFEEKVPLVPFKPQARPYGFDLPIGAEDDSKTNGEFYESLKAQGYWVLKQLCYNTYMLKKKKKENPNVHINVLMGRMYLKKEDLICLPSSLDNLRDLIDELCQVTVSLNSRGRIVIDKQPPKTKSPNMADAVMMCFHNDDCSSMRNIRESELKIRG